MTKGAVEIKYIHPNLEEYDSFRKSFSWENERKTLDGLPNNRGLNIAFEAVDRHALGALKNKVALRCIQKDFSAKNFSYFDLYKQTSRFANVLTSLTIQKGNRVCTLTGRIPELYFTAFGALKRGAVFCPLFSVFGPEPIFQRLSRGDVRLLVTTSDSYEKKIKQLLDRLPQLKYILLTDSDKHVSEKVLSMPLLMKQAPETFQIPATSPEDPALLHFTSGTTGMPKGALHVHNAVLTHSMTGKYVLDFHPADVYWCTADPGWVTGTSYGIITPLVNGITNIVDEEEFDAARWYSILEQQKVNIWYTAPTAIRRLMRMDIKPLEQYDLNPLRVVLSVGEPLHAEAVKWGKEKLGINILDNWWQTETGGIMIANYPSLNVKPGSMGKPLPGVEAAIAEIKGMDFNILTQPNKQGYLLLKKGWPSMFRAYINEKERYEKCFHGDWYITGDLVKRDEDGYYWFVGRADDIIKTSGHMVGPFEVERILMEHPAIAEAAVIGKPDELIGELVKAFIVLKSEFKDSDETRRDIIAFARKRLGAAVAPKEIEVIQNLPKTRSGKILRRLLKAKELGLPEGDTSTLEQS